MTHCRKDVETYCGTRERKMKRGRWLGGMLALGLCVVCVEPAAADRVPSVRTGGQRANGARPDITVPYLNNGTNAFNAANVKPKIYSSPVVDDPKAPQAKPVFN